METTEYRDIYQNQAEGYEELVSHEDYEGHILPALQQICDLDGRVVVDLGTGTGRLVKLLAPKVTAVYGFDRSLAMLAVARREMHAARASNWALAAAGHRHLPLASRCCDLIVSGWSLCYLALDQGPEWREGLLQVIRWMRRMLRPGGTIIILETMGSGFSEPNPPPFMRDYFNFLVEIGMASTWISTDYQFESPGEAVRLTRFFFGDELAEKVHQQNSPIVPECTGIWWSNDVDSLRLNS